MARLKLSGIGKVYLSGEAALHDVSLQADTKEFLVIVGGEKCGKTSLLKIIAGLEEPTCGTVEIDGKDVTDVEPKDRDVAMVFRNDTLYPTLNVYDNMAYGLRMRRASAAVIDQRVKSAAAVLGLTEVLYRKPKTLSAADRQRVALGRAIAREPKLYLLDEPLAGIDENLRRDMLNLIINVQARMEGTFIYATKNLSEALTIGTRIVILKKGFIQQIDTPQNLYDYPANTFVAFLIGSPTVNFLQKVKIVKEEGYVAVYGDNKFALPQAVIDRFENIDTYVSEQKSVILAIRPEDISAGGDVKADFVKEYQADPEYSEFSFGGANITARAGKDAAGLNFDLNRLCIFDSKTRLTLLKRDGGYINTGKPDADVKPLSYHEELKIAEGSKPKKVQKKK